MKRPNRIEFCLFVIAVFWLKNPLGAEIVEFGSNANRFEIDFVPIGYTNNTADMDVPNGPIGSVGYEYGIGRFEISREMISKATSEGSLGITLDPMADVEGGPRDGMPATGISWIEAAKFVNWLNVSSGFSPAYKFSGPDFHFWQSGEEGYDPSNQFRNSNAAYFLPSMNEWHKAAHYLPSLDSYLDFPTDSVSEPMAVPSGTSPQTAVFGQTPEQGPADVMAAGGLSSFGTMGQGGNVFEWIETDGLGDAPSTGRRFRGGYFAGTAMFLEKNNTGATIEASADPGFITGFRVASRTTTFDTDEDGLLDLMDAPGFAPGLMPDVGGFQKLGIEDLDGAHRLKELIGLTLSDNQLTDVDRGDFDGLTNLINLRLDRNHIAGIDTGDFSNLPNLQFLRFRGNQVTNIGPDAFAELPALRHLDLRENPIARLADGAFAGAASLQDLLLYHNQLTELNLTGATFTGGSDPTSGLGSCERFENEGFCVDGENITSLILDGATLNWRSYEAIVGQLDRGEFSVLTDASLVGLVFSGESPPPPRFNQLMVSSLENITVDEQLFEIYADEFTAFGSMEGKTVTVVPGQCDVNRDGICNDADIDAMTDLVISGKVTFEERTALIEHPIPTGFHSYYGDANLDGEFNTNDLVAVFRAAEYEDELAGNSTWAEGDWNGDRDFSSGDLVAAFRAGGYEHGPRNTQAVPESTSIATPLILLMAALCSVRDRNTTGACGRCSGSELTRRCQLKYQVVSHEVDLVPRVTPHQ